MEFFERLKNSWKIFKLSFSLLSKDKSLMIIPVLMLISFFILILLFILSPFFAINLINSNYNYIVFILLAVLFYFWIIFLEAAQTWMVYEVLQGKDTTLKSGLKRAINNIGDLIAFVSVMLLIRIFSSWLRNKGRIGEYAGNFIDYISGIAGKLVLPAMIVTEKNFKEAAEQLKHSIKAIPEIATYEIGIRPLTTLAFFAGLFLSFLLGISLGFFVGIIVFFIAMLFTILLSVYINNSYYTILYLTLIEKKKVKGLNLFKP